MESEQQEAGAPPQSAQALSLPSGVLGAVLFVSFWLALAYDQPLWMTGPLAVGVCVLVYRATPIAHARSWMLGLIPFYMTSAWLGHLLAFVSQPTVFAFVGVAVLATSAWVCDVVFSVRLLRATGAVGNQGHWARALWRHALTAGHPIDETDLQLQRTIFTNFTSIPWSLSAAGYLVAHLGYAMYDHALLQGISICVAMWALLYLRHSNNLALTGHMLSMVGASSLLYFLYTGGIAQTGYLWIPLFSFLMYLVAPSTQVALCWIVAVGMAIAAMVLGQYAGLLHTPYSPLQLVICLSAYATFAFCADLYDSLRGSGFLAFVKKIGALNAIMMTQDRGTLERLRVAQDHEWERTHDRDTRLLNRVGFLEYMQSQAARRAIAIIHVRIPLLADEKRWHNSQHRHSASVHIAKLLGQLPVLQHNIARCSADQFSVGIVFAQRPSLGLVDSVADKVMALLQKPIALDEELVSAPAIVGVAIRQWQDTPSVEDVYRQAVSATFMKAEPSHMGGVGLRYFDAIRSRLPEDATDLQVALLDMAHKNAFHLAFEPQWDCTQTTIDCAYASLRWDVTPKTFALGVQELVPVARTLGLGKIFSKMLLSKACQHIQLWSHSGLSPMPIAIEQTIEDLQNPDFLATLDAALDSGGINPKMLRIAVAEASIAKDLDAARAAISHIRQRGIAVTVTNFGSSYLSLGYLDPLELDAVQLDPALLQSLHGAPAPGRTSAIEALAALLRTLGLCVVIDGVETQEQAIFIAQRNLGMARGSYYTTPLNTSEFTSYCRSKSMGMGTNAIAVGR